MGLRTEAEAIADEQKVLGQAYGLAYYHACQEFWRVSSAWDQYESLFGSQERVDILNRTSASFWGAIQGVLFEHVLLGLCRLADPPKTGRFVNLSVCYLQAIDPTPTKAGLTSRVKAATRATSFAKNWRDKRIAHNDLAHSTGTAAVQRATIAKVRKAILAVHDVLRWIRARYFDSEMYLVELSDGETSSLLARLNAALHREAEEEAAMERGDFSAMEARRDYWPKESYGLSERYHKQQERPLPKKHRGRLPLAT